MLIFDLATNLTVITEYESFFVCLMIFSTLDSYLIETIFIKLQTFKE
jgi:hypothetical protein